MSGPAPDEEAKTESTEKNFSLKNTVFLLNERNRLFVKTQKPSIL